MAERRLDLETDAVDIGKTAEDLDALFERASERPVLRDGIHDGIAEADYHADPCPEPSLSASIAKVLLGDSPAHARCAHPRLNPQHVEDDDEKFDAGKALHALFLEGRDILLRLPFDDWKKKEAREARDNARAAGLIPVTRPQYERIMRAGEMLVRRVQELEETPAPFAAGKPEQTLIWQEDNGIWCRARLDWLHADHSCIDDLKIVASANPGDSPGTFGRAVWNLGHDIQAAFYRRGLKKLAGIDARFRFMCFELAAPNAISLPVLSPRAVAVGDLKVARAIGLWAHCLATNTWPDFPRYAVEIDVPDYEAARWEAAALEDECLL